MSPKSASEQLQDLKNKVSHLSSIAITAAKEKIAEIKDPTQKSEPHRTLMEYGKIVGMRDALMILGYTAAVEDLDKLIEILKGP